MTIGIWFLAQTVGAARSRRGFVPLAAALAAVNLGSRSACASPRPRSLDDGDPGRNQSDLQCHHDAKWGREVRWIASARQVLKSQRDARNSAPLVGTRRYSSAQFTSAASCRSARFLALATASAIPVKASCRVPL
jgi:hypothetical protein